MNNASVELLVYAMRLEAKNIISIELREPNNHELPSFSAGAHIDLKLDIGLFRSYSLLNSPGDRDRYLIAVLKNADGQGGSRFIHEELRVGQRLSCTLPRNNFPLDEAAERTVLVAGGIGITPILSMMDRLVAAGKNFRLLYCARSRNEAAFVEYIAANFGDNASFYFDDEHGGPPDLMGILANQPKQTHFYCCGPAPMLEAFEKVCSASGYENTHIERFAAPLDVAREDLQDYEVFLKKKGITVKVPRGTPMIDALEEAGVDIPFSCREGVCGACETRVLSGIPEHRDSVLSIREQVLGQKIMVCVSGCKSASLTLDL